MSRKVLPITIIILVLFMLITNISFARETFIETKTKDLGNGRLEIEIKNISGYNLSNVTLQSQNIQELDLEREKISVGSINENESHKYIINYISKYGCNVNNNISEDSTIQTDKKIEENPNTSDIGIVSYIIILLICMILLFYLLRRKMKHSAIIFVFLLFSIFNQNTALANNIFTEYISMKFNNCKEYKYNGKLTFEIDTSVIENIDHVEIDKEIETRKIIEEPKAIETKKNREVSKETETNKNIQQLKEAETEEIIEKTIESETKQQPKETETEERIIETKEADTKEYIEETSQKIILEDTIIPYKTIRKHDTQGAKTRVVVKGVEGKKTDTILINYANGKEISRKTIKTNTINPINEVVETYVKLKDEVIEKKMVDKTGDFELINRVENMKFFRPVGENYKSYNGGMNYLDIDPSTDILNTEKGTLLLSGKIKYLNPRASNEVVLWTLNDAKNYVNSLKKIKFENNSGEVSYQADIRSLPAETFFIAPSQIIIDYLMDNIITLGNWGDLSDMYVPTGKTIKYTIINYDYQDVVIQEEKWGWQ